MKYEITTANNGYVLDWVTDLGTNHKEVYTEMGFLISRIQELEGVPSHERYSTVIYNNQELQRKLKEHSPTTTVNYVPEGTPKRVIHG